MRIQLSFKCPDAVSVALDQIKNEDKRELARDAISKFVKYGEYVRIEVDTDKGTAKVIPV